MNISIITPCLNRVQFITEAIESVLMQNYPNFEHIIIDGGSTDGTLEILKQYPHLRIISEPDEGVYDAFNKGIKLANGAIIGFLNTDDAYAPNAFYQAASLFSKYPSAQAVNGTAQLFCDTTGERSIIAEYTYILQKELPVRATIGVPAINSWFFRSEVISRLGFFDTSYKISADRHLILKFLYNNFPYQNIHELVYLYRQHDASMTITGKDVYYENFVFEHLRMAETFLADPHTPAEMKKACRFWHSRDTTILAIRNLYTSPWKAFEYMAIGIRFDTNWLFYFGRQLAHALKHSINKK